MLVKYRGLTLVDGFAMAVAIAVGTTFFKVTSQVLNPALPLEDGERVVALQYATASPGNPERRVLHDFLDWREEIGSVEHDEAYASRRARRSGRTRSRTRQATFSRARSSLVKSN
jgi:hypothetical protein